jgi:hypothetical protein
MHVHASLRDPALVKEPSGPYARKCLFVHLLSEFSPRYCLMSSNRALPSDGCTPLSSFAQVPGACPSPLVLVLLAPVVVHKPEIPIQIRIERQERNHNN